MNVVLSCKDQMGLIQQMSLVLAHAQANIIKFEEHVEDGQFFCRFQWEDQSNRSIQYWQNQFQKLLAQLNAQAHFNDERHYAKVVLFCSKPLHCLLDILNHVQLGDLPIRIQAVISNHQDAQPFVERLNIPFHYCPTHHISQEEHEELVLTLLDQYTFDFMGLARYMRILSSDFLQSLNKPIINVHHSFLPSFIGANPYEKAYHCGVKLIGATAHFVTKDLDEGPIIHQEVVRVSHLDSVSELKLKGKSCECKTFFQAIKKQAENKLAYTKGRVIVFH